MLTSQATIAIKLSSSNNYVDISDQSAGVSGWNDTISQRTRPIPTIQGSLAVQLLIVRDGNVNFTIDDNSITHPLLFLRSGEEFNIRIRPAGDGAGKEQTVHTGLMTISLNNAPGGARTFQCTLTTTSVDAAAQR